MRKKKTKEDEKKPKKNNEKWEKKNKNQKRKKKKNVVKKRKRKKIKWRKQANRSKSDRSPQISFLGYKGRNPQPSQGPIHVGVGCNSITVVPPEVKARNEPLTAGEEAPGVFCFLVSRPLYSEK